MASISAGLAPGIRLATAATAFATAPVTAARAVCSREGSCGFASRLVLREAAARAAFRLRATLLVVLRAAARFVAPALRFGAALALALDAGREARLDRDAALRAGVRAVLRPPVRAVLRA